MSVPYALYASKTDTSVLNLAGRFSGKLNVANTVFMLNPYLRKTDFPLGTSTGNIQYWNGTGWVNLSPGLPGQILSTYNTSKLVWLSTLPVIITNSVSDVNPNIATGIGTSALMVDYLLLRGV